MKMNGQQLPISQTIKLPIPRLPNPTTTLHTSNAKFPEMLIPANWSPTASTQFPTNLPSTQHVITCQPMLTNSSIGKPIPNKRGRKPLSRMPETKKHIQNLTNQRAFRRRREDYVRTLETKANTYEMLYNEAQNDIKMLRDRLALLERRLAKAQVNNNDKRGINVSSSQHMSEGNLYQSIEGQNNDDNSGDIVMSNGTYDGNRTLSVITPTTISSFSFNEQRYQQQIISNDKGSLSKSAESIEDIISDPVFCETRDGDICFCESIDELHIDDIEKDHTHFSSVGRHYLDQKSGKRMWIIPKRTAAQCTTPTTSFSNITTCNDSSRECCPTPSSEQSGSQWPSQQQQESYFSPSPSPIATTQHHPLNLKWILDENHNDENSDDSA